MRKVGALLLAGIAFGVLVAVVKGQNADIRGALGKTSAPWIVLPFFAVARFGRVWQAALAGLAVTLASLLAFYVSEAAILDLGPHPWWEDLRLTAGTFNIYEKWGFVSGLLYGTLGWLWAYRSKVLAGIAVGLAFLAEPLMVYMAKRAGLWGGGGLFDHTPWIWIGEIAIGLTLVVLVVAKPPPGHAPAV